VFSFFSNKNSICLNNAFDDEHYHIQVLNNILFFLVISAVSAKAKLAKSGSV